MINSNSIGSILIPNQESSQSANVHQTCQESTFPFWSLKSEELRKPPTEPPAFLPSKFGRQDHPFTLNWRCIGTTRKVTHLGFPDRGEGFKGDLCVFSTEAMPSRCFPQFAIHFPPKAQCHLTNTENLLLVPFLKRPVSLSLQLVNPTASSSVKVLENTCSRKNYNTFW